MAKISDRWPETLVGCLDEVYEIGLIDGEAVSFNYAQTYKDFVGVAHVKEGQARVDIWVNIQKVIWIEAKDAKVRHHY